jgi:type IV pilus biogenesis protein CpaD/CtpE
MEWNIGRRAAMVVAATGLLAGCAQVPRQAFNAQAAAHVKTVVVACPENQKEYRSTSSATRG